MTDQRTTLKPHRLIAALAVVTAAVTAVVVLFPVFSDRYRPADLLFTRDQQGEQLFDESEFARAADTFEDPFWQGAAAFRDGDFKRAASVYSGFDTADAAYNHGNALLMQGLYEDAIERYDRALELEPDRADAHTNRAIAVARAEKTRKEGGNMTGGQMGADDFTFTKQENTGDEQETETIEDGAAPDNASQRAIWLRRVQTKPADFLRSKFAYQVSTGKEAE